MNGGRETDYLLERRLKAEAPELLQRATDSITVLKRMLTSYASWFPNFTDHSALHSMDVLEFCNQILGDQVNKLNGQECYVLLMSCYLHDIGMGIHQKDYEFFSF